MPFDDDEEEKFPSEGQVAGGVSAKGSKAKQKAETKKRAKEVKGKAGQHPRSGKGGDKGGEEGRLGFMH